MEQAHSEPVQGDLVTVSRRLRPALIAFFLRRVRDPSLAEDLTQDLFCRLASGTHAGIGNPQGYIFQIAANLVRDHYRRETVRTRYQRIVDLGEDRDVDPIDAERLLCARESVGRVAQVLGSLPERTRAIFILYRLENMQRKAIADAFGISVSAVEKHIANAMRVLLREVGSPR